MDSLFTFRFDITRRALNYDVLMVFSAVPMIEPDVLATSIEGEIETNLAPDEIVVVVREPFFQEHLEALTSDSLNLATMERLRNRTTITLVGYDCNGAEVSRAKLRGPDPARKVKLEDFKRRAVTSIFNARHGFVESTATYHFENPSGRHTERFIRLSNILARGAEIAFLGFCTLPYIPKDASVAYLDTPSLYAVVAAINEQRSSFGGEAPAILADNFSSYAGFTDYRFGRMANAVVLISASSSGSLAKRLIEEREFSSDNIVHLLFLGKDKSGAKKVCDLGKHSRDNPDGIDELPAVEEAASCRMCQSGSHAIPLQGDQFEFAGPQQESLLITKNHAPAELARLMERYAGQSIFEVGLRRTIGPNPRQFNINPAQLLASANFQDRLSYLLRRSLPASVSHVIALDRNSVPLAEQVTRSGVTAIVVERDNLDSIPDNTDTAILIVAAVVESGRSLLDVSRDLRSIVPKAPLLYLVGISKTTGEPRREALDRNLVQTHNYFPYQFVAAERIVLPVSAETHPWVAELNLLIDPDVQALIPESLQSTIEARIARLRRTSQALTDELFLPNAKQPLRLQPGFVFWPDGVPSRAHSQADVYFTISSVLQQLRANAHQPHKAAIKSNWFQQTILAPGNFGRFNDDIIQASILRAAYSFEMNFMDRSSDSRELSRLIRRIVEACRHERGGAATEFLLALATRRLRLARQDLEVVLETYTETTPMVEFMRSVCTQRLLSPDSE